MNTYKIHYNKGFSSIFPEYLKKRGITEQQFSRTLKEAGALTERYISCRISRFLLIQRVAVAIATFEIAFLAILTATLIWVNNSDLLHYILTGLLFFIITFAITLVVVRRSFSYNPKAAKESLMNFLEAENVHVYNKVGAHISLSFKPQVYEMDYDLDEPTLTIVSDFEMV